MDPAFERFETQDAIDLIREFPLAWVTARGGGAETASLLPLLPETDEQGRLVSLLGHMSRGNALLPALRADPRALILFQGPQAYISGSWVHDRGWVPTWNFAQLRIEGDLRFTEGNADEALAALVEVMERGRENAWAIEEAGTRYRSMEQRIIAFRVSVDVLLGRFKLGQDERPEILADILAQLDRTDPPLARWTRRFNPGRC